LRYKLLLGISSLLLGYHHDRPALEVGKAGDDGGIVAKIAVTVDLLKIGEKPLDVIERVGTLGMARQQDPAPGGMRLGRDFRRSFRLCVGIHFSTS